MEVAKCQIMKKPVKLAFTGTNLRQIIKAVAGAILPIDTLHSRMSTPTLINIQ
jgi:hypothetical protein